MAKRTNALEQMRKWMKVIPQCLQAEKQRTFEDDVISYELEITKREFEKQGFIPPEFKNEEEMCNWLSLVAELRLIDRKLNRAQKEVERLKEERREHINRYNLNKGKS